MADPTQPSAFMQQYNAGGAPLNPVAENDAAQTDKDRMAWNTAATTPDPKQALTVLDQLSKNSTNPVVSDLAYEKKKELATKLTEYERIKQGVYSAGTPGTPEGNIAIAGAIQKYSHKPQLGQALIASILGQDATAYKLITGGEQKTQIKWGKEGDRYYQTVDGFGNHVKTVDAMGNELSDQDLQDRGVSYDSFDNTIAGATSKEMNKVRGTAANEDQQANVKFYSTFVPQEQFVANALNDLQSFKNVPADSLREALSIASKNLTVGKSGSTNVQKGTNKSESATASNEKNAALKVGGATAQPTVPGETGGGLSGNLAVGGSSKTGESASGGSSNLNISTTGKQNEESNVQKTRQLLIAARLKGLDEQQIDKLLNAHQLINKLAQDQSSLADYKKPGFVARLAPQEVGDNLGLLKAELLKAQYNITQLKNYQPYYNGAIEAYNKTGMAPPIGQIETQFVQHPDQQRTNQSFAASIGAVLRDASKNQSPQQPQESGAVAPPVTASPANAPVASKPPPAAAPKIPAGWTLHTDSKGNKAYVSPDKKQFIEVK
jgi:hypothetical protein